MKTYSLPLAAIQKDLRELVDAQEAFFADHVRYSDSLDALPFEPSPGVEVALTHVSERGWGATATYADMPQIQCGILVGAGLAA